MIIDRIHLRKTLLALATVRTYQDDSERLEGHLNQEVGAEFKGWSLSSCFQWLSGKRCKRVLETIDPEILSKHGLSSEAVSKILSFSINECIRRNLGCGYQDESHFSSTSSS